MLTKRDLLSSLAGMVLGPILLLGIAYLVGGKEILAPLNEAADRMLEWIQRDRKQPDQAIDSASPDADDQASSPLDPESLPDESAGMMMSATIANLPLLACPGKECARIASIPAGGKVRMLGQRAGEGSMEWSHVQFDRHQGWVPRQDLE